MIDHGYGLQTVYGHLSEFLVKKGDMVKKGQTIGKTGSTGLAGGDHLHFTMQVDGVQVNAVEWWDPHWVKDRILSKMGDGHRGRHRTRLHRSSRPVTSCAEAPSLVDSLTAGGAGIGS